QITGTDEDDILLGSHLDDVLDGGAGNDILLADGGRNILLGGGENDRFVADTGTHLINGGAGASDKVLITDYYDLSALSGAQGRIVYDGFDAVVEMEDVEEIWFDTRIFGGSLTIRSTLDLFGAPTPKQNGAAANDVLTGTDARDWLGG
ncbi:calcium-binding protein, partial [Sulfitobacter donghicola]